MTVPVHGLPLLVREGLEVFVVPPHLKGPRSFVVAEAESDGRWGQLVSLRGVGTLDAAERLVGRTLLARVADLPDDLALHDAEALSGREVHDVAMGPLGTLDEVMMGPANDVWVVHGPLGEVLVPVTPQVVLEVPAQGAIEVALPAGLLEGDDES